MSQTEDDGEPVSCRGCGRQATPPALGWSRDGDGVWLCDTCVRDNLRSIEAKLDTEWW
ncbi:hypothetical protein [Fodinicola acaciae]|uniref:hypothetical protein n=1 Tax=Fodinicola acaciae TaxID=2681555 RepID=UPI001651DA44|nr:hypothetical protein [Fodinicola acaciae]